jgi:hypothetical protein
MIQKLFKATRSILNLLPRLAELRRGMMSDFTLH